MTATVLLLALAVILHAYAGATSAWLTARTRRGRIGWGALTAGVLISGAHAGFQLILAARGLLEPPPELGFSLCLVGGLLALAVSQLRPALSELTHRADQPAATERKFRSFFEQLPVGVALSEIADEHTRLVEHNEALSDFLGLSEGTGSLSIDALAHPDELEEGAARLAQLSTGTSPQLSHEQRYILGDGTVAWGLVTTTVLRDGQGDATHTLSAVQDITERKRAEEALRGERDRANTILDVAEVLLISTDIRGVIQTANRKAAAVLGRPMEELIGQNWTEIGFSESSRQIALDLLHALVDGETRVSPAFEGSLVDPDGVQRVVAWRCAAVRDEAGSITGTLCSGIDVTGRSEALTRFRQERGRVESIMATSPIAVIVVNRRGHLIYANEEAERQVGEVESSAGKSFIESADWTIVDWAGKAVPFEELPFGKVIASGEALRGGRYGLLYPDGRHARLLVNITPLSEDTHGLSGVVATLQDVTGALELDARARKAERMDAIRRLALGAAHDFNNALTAIVGSAEIGLVDHPEGQVGERFQAILNSALAAAELTARLQSIGSLKPLAPVPLRMLELAASAQVAAESVGEGRSVSSTVPPDPGLRVAADRAALEMVIASLLRNAREAAGPDGTVRMATKLVTLSGSGDLADGRYVEMAVTDSGEGIDPEVRHRMFEPYFSTRTGRPGLGLSQAISVIERLGGHFIVSEEGPTTVSFRLPIEEPVQTTPEPAAPRTLEDLPRGTETVLVVEDEDEVVFLLRMVLERQGYRVLTASTCAGALELIESADAVHLLLTDVHLPDGSGTEVGVALRDRNPKAPIVFISGMGNESLDIDLSSAHTRFIAKPFTVGKIAGGVREALDA